MSSSPEDQKPAADASPQQALQSHDGERSQLKEEAAEVKPEPVFIKEEPGTAQQAGSEPGPSKISQQYSQGTLRHSGGVRNGLTDPPPRPNSSAQGYTQPQAAEQAPAGQPGGSKQHEGAPVQDEAVRKQVSTSDIQRVQNFIETCLQQYLSQKEVIMQLQQQFKIEPCFTQLVWQKLEEQNQEFFKAYYTRLKLKDQIILFNHLLEEQVKMFHRMPRGQMMPGAAPAGQGMAYPSGLMGASGLASMPMQPGISAQPQATSSGLHSSTDPISQPAQLNPDPAQLSMNEFPGISIDGAPGDLPADLAGIGQSLPFSGSEINLANLVSFGSPGRSNLGGVGDHVDLSGLPRNFSLSDLALDQVNEGEHGLPHNISLSDLPAFDIDSGGEQS